MPRKRRRKRDIGRTELHRLKFGNVNALKEFTFLLTVHVGLNDFLGGLRFYSSLRP